jgi:hypothetical protein
MREFRRESYTNEIYRACRDLGNIFRSNPCNPETSLSAVKLAKMESFTTDVLKQSLMPGQKECLKTRPDGTILDGHHRVHVLRRRGVEVDALPREIVVKGND